MTPELWQRVCRAFEQVVELPPAQRGDFLRSLQQSDAEVCAQVEALLGNHDAPSILESPPAEIWDALADAATGISIIQPGKEWPAAIGSYLIEGELARGGMGIVLKANDPKFGRPLAVKILDRRHVSDGSLGQRFLEEARITGQLQHPGIPPVYDMGRLPDGRPFLAMKLIHGRTLAELLTAAKRLETSSAPTTSQDVSANRDLTRFIDIFDQICQTMAYAHTCKVIHRDLKPNNIMVGAFGEVQVMDWGLAKQLGVAACGLALGGDIASAKPQAALADVPDGRTQPGSVMGTPAYIAPEQARGQVESLDERSDVFGLGAILCEILTGRPPFAADSSSQRLQLAKAGDVSDAFMRLDSPRIDPALSALTKQCLAPERGDRPSDAGVVAVAVDKYRTALQDRLRKAEIEQAAAVARADAEQAKVREERRRRNATRALAALSIVFVIAVSAGILWHFRQQAETAAREEAAKSRREQERAELRAANSAGVHAMLNQDEYRAANLAVILSNYDDANVLLSDLEDWQKNSIGRRQEVLGFARGMADEFRQKAPDLKDPKMEERWQERWDLFMNDSRDFDLALQLDNLQLSAYLRAQEKKSVAPVGIMYGTFFAEKFHIDVEKTDPQAAADAIIVLKLRYVVVAALDHWAEISQNPGSEFGDLLPRLLEIARRADSDPEWRDRFRKPSAWKNGDTLATLAREYLDGPSNKTYQAAKHSPQLLLAFARQLDRNGKRDLSLAVMYKASLQFPRNYWLKLNMPYYLNDPQEKPGYAQAALGLRTESAVACIDLGSYFFELGKYDAAKRAFEKAAELHQDDRSKTVDTQMISARISRWQARLEEAVRRQSEQK